MSSDINHTYGRRVIDVGGHAEETVTVTNVVLSVTGATWWTTATGMSRQVRVKIRQVHVATCRILTRRFSRTEV